MNYIELINRFWELDEAWQFSCCETRLYFYLLKTANRLGWENNWTHSDDKTSANVGVSKNSFKTARHRLSQAGLISFKEGGKGFGNKTRYQILTPKVDPKLHPKVDPKLHPKVDPIINKQKLNQTKVNIREEKSKRFIPPILEEIKNYCLERGNSVNPESFFNHYQANGWMRGKAKLKDWRAAVRYWEINEKKYENKSDKTNNSTGRIKDYSKK